MCERRTDRLLDVNRSFGLPPFLAEDAGRRLGAHDRPVRPGGPRHRDEASGLTGQRRLHSLVGYAGGPRLDGLARGAQAAQGTRRASATSWRSSCVASARALALRAPLCASPVTAAIADRVNALAGGPGHDRWLSPEIAAVSDLVASARAARSSVSLRHPALKEESWKAPDPFARKRGTELDALGWPQEAALAHAARTTSTPRSPSAPTTSSSTAAPARPRATGAASTRWCARSPR